MHGSAARVLEPLPVSDEPRLQRTRAPSALVLLADANPTTRRALQRELVHEGFRVLEAGSGAEAIGLAETHNPDFVLLETSGAFVDGLDVTQKLRRWTMVPIVVLSTVADEAAKVELLDAGANDCLTKPCGSRELVARMRVWLRAMNRVGPSAADSVLEAGDLKVDLERRVAYVKNREVHFTPTEYKLVTTLLKSAGKVLTHEEILVAVWGPAYAAETQYLRVFVGQIRAKIEETPARPRYLVTESGVGYRMRTD